MLDMEQKIKIFKALGNETRFLIFKNVFTGGYTCSIDEKKAYSESVGQAICVATIAENFDFALPTISKHLKELKEAQIITMTKRGNKIYIEPNIKIVKELSECFSTMLGNFENLQQNDVALN